MPNKCLSLGVCHLTSMPVRRKPDLVSEMTTELLFGEAFSVLKKSGQYAQVRLAHDGFIGWVDGRQILEISQREFKRLTTGSIAVAIDPVTAARRLDERAIVQIVKGSSLPGISGGKVKLGKRYFRFSGKFAEPKPEPINRRALLAHFKSYLGVPYVWGGRSPFGIDCSGFMQVGFKAFGIQLGRNTTHQIKEGREINFAERKTGDIALFATGPEASRHVGIIVPGGIIHASAFVRMDDFDETGITNRETGERTHELTVIRRVIRE